MFRRFIFPILVLVLAILACNNQTAPPASTPAVIPDATASPDPTNTPVTSSVITDTLVGPTAVPGGLTLDMLRNDTYHTPFYDRTVTLVNGSYSESSGSNILSVQMLDIYAFGDLNDDGKDDVAILLAENGGGSGTFVSVIAILNQGGTPHQVSQAQLGDRVVINSVDISSGVINLDMVVHGPADPMCCPSLPQKQNYWLIGNRLWLMRLTSTIGATEHLINVDIPTIWATVANPFTVSGSMTVLPFENTLAYRIYQMDGTKVNESSFSVTHSVGISGIFSHDFNLGSAGITDWVIIQFVDVSAADGSTIALGSVIMKAH